LRTWDTLEPELFHDVVELPAAASGHISHGLAVHFAPAGTAYFIDSRDPAVEVLPTGCEVYAGL
jgi:hypothetical protein